MLDAYYQNNPAKTAYETRTATDYANQQGYTNQAFPAGNHYKYTIHYYDDYDFDNNGSVDAAYQSVGIGPATAFRAYGKLTGSKTVLIGTSQYLTTVTFYDQEGRVVQTQSENILSGKDVLTTSFDFAGRVTESRHTHTATINSSVKTVNSYQQYQYDNAGRLKGVQQKTFEGTTEPTTAIYQPIAANSYNELGQLTEKLLGGTLQQVDYAYNIRGWLQKINDAALSETKDLFGMELDYQAGSGLTEAQKQFNGNIARQSWKSRSDNVSRSYTYGYDGLNRLLSADYKSTVTGESFSLSGMDYDDNGNIKSLTRSNLVKRNNLAAPTFGEVDKLTYNYTGQGNRLKWVDDYHANTNALADDFTEKSKNSGTHPGYSINATEYAYDASGNMNRDENKGISSITYNYLNLPVKITFTNGDPAPDPEATGPHTQLGSKDGSKGRYNQAREFDANGKPVRDIDFTDHGRPQNHPNPHQHRYVPNSTGGSPRRGEAESLN